MLTGARGADTIRLEIPFQWTDSNYAYHTLDTGWFSFGMAHPPPLVAPFTEVLCSLTRDTAIGGVVYDNFLSQDSTGGYTGTMYISNCDSNYIAGTFNVNVYSTGPTPAVTIPVSVGYFVYSFRKTTQP